jgi:hypothetical protein
MNQQETYISNLLQRRIQRHGLKPTQGQFDGLFRDFLDLWQQAESEAVCPRESKLWLLSALNSYLLVQVAKRNAR